jgi:hypothetical protein
MIGNTHVWGVALNSVDNKCEATIKDVNILQ